MDFKEFFKPTKMIIATFAVLMIVTSAVPNIGISDEPEAKYPLTDFIKIHGYPFNFMHAVDQPAIDALYSKFNITETQAQQILLVPWPAVGAPLFNYLNFVLDVMFWYLISCSIALIYKKVKKT